MRVLHLISREGVAPYRLHTALRRIGIDSMMFVATKWKDDPSVIEFRPPSDVWSRLRRRVRAARIDRDRARYDEAHVFELFTDDRSIHDGDALRAFPACDVINVHTLLRTADFTAFHRTVPQRTPVVRTLHDMNLFTGGCHQDAGCGRYAEGCGLCPQLGSRQMSDLSRKIWERKRQALETVDPRRLHFVAPSKYLADEARRSPLLQRFSITVIPLGVDVEIFRPVDRALARTTLGLPADATVVLFVSEPVTRRNKGFGVLVEALDGLTGINNLWLLSAGSGELPARPAAPHLHLGRVSDERFLALVYNAADVFVIPSAQENFPQTAIEALACGVPVVGSDAGGIPEIVRSGLTGILVPIQEVVPLRRVLNDLLRDRPRLQQMGECCRRVAVDEYALEIQARRYAELYRSITDGDPEGPARQHRRPI